MGAYGHPDGLANFRGCLHMRRLLFVSVLVAALVGAGLVTGSSAAPAPSTDPSSSTADTALDLAGAQQVVRDHGYTPIQMNGYEPQFDLSVVVGMLSTSADGHPQQAFLFHRGTFVGTDTTPSAAVRWVWSTGNVVALQYDLYRSDDPMCCPSAGAATVRYQWDGDSVVPQDPIPTSDWEASASRR